MQVRQNFRKETRSVLIIAAVSVIVISLLLVIFLDSKFAVTAAAILSTLTALLLGLFISPPRDAKQSKPKNRFSTSKK